MIQQFYFWAYTQKNWKQDLKEIFVHPWLQQHYSQELKHGSNQCPSIDEWISKMWSIHTTQYHSAYQNSLICYNMDASWGHYAKWNKHHKKTSTIWFHLHEVLSVVKITETKSRMVVAKGPGGGEDGELLFNGDTVSVLQDERILETCGDDVCTTLWLYLIQLNCTLKNG